MVSCITGVAFYDTHGDTEATFSTKAPGSPRGFTMLIHVFGISGVLYHGGGGGTKFHKIISFLVDYIVKKDYIYPKI